MSFAKKDSKKKTGKPKDDDALWQAVTQDTKPLPKSAKNRHRPEPDHTQREMGEVPPPIPKAQPRTGRTPHSAPSSQGALGRPEVPALSHGTTAGIDKRTAARMKKGTLKIEGRIDLHGMTQDEAHPALGRFIMDAAAAGKRQVLVITGKGDERAGTGVLRARVPHWLNAADLRPLVVVFDYAAPKDGGAGALYVRLRKPRET